MKASLLRLAFFTLLSLAAAPLALRAQDAPPPPPPDQGDQGGGDDQGASFQTFYDQLSDQGTWVQTDNYGYAFQPNVSDPNWAPYSDGHWVSTDAGWMWVSDEPWGWATYHYGRWANIDGTGWVWVPGYRWAPAWVSWRYGGGYAGWAPLPPETFAGPEYGDGGVSVGVGFHFGGDVDVNFNIGPGCYNFIGVGDFGENNYRGHYIDRSRNYTVINNTTNITNINVNRTTINNYNGAGAGADFRGVTNGGPSLADVNAHSHTRLQTVTLAPSNTPGRANVSGNTVAVYAPHFNPATAKTSKPASVAQTISHPKINHGDSITRPLQVTSSVHAPAPSAEAIQEAKTAQMHAPASAHIATEKTHGKTLSKPLTSMQPVTHTQASASHAMTPATTHTESANAPAATHTESEVKEPAAQHEKATEPTANAYHSDNAPATETHHTEEPTTVRPDMTPSIEKHTPESKESTTHSAPASETHHTEEHNTEEHHTSTGGGTHTEATHSPAKPSGGGDKKSEAKGDGDKKKQDGH